VTVGSIRALIDSKGIFRFSKAGVSVIDGKLKIENSGLALQKGWQVTDTGGDYRESKVVLTVPPPFKSFLNSPKAGFVNAIQGEANVRASEVAREDQPIKTGPSSYLEVLLSPGAFLRIDENSEVKIDSAGLSDVVIQVVSGSALIEDVAMDPRLAIRVIVGGAKLLIAGSGLYRFTNDTASVIDGLLRLGSKDESAAGGTLVRVTDRQYVTEDLSVEPERTGLDLWSAQRSALLARANFMADYAEWEANFFYFTNPVPHLAAWIYSPPLKGFTFIPRLNRESFYGNSFVPLYVLMPSVPFAPSSRVPTPQPPAAPNARPATVPPPKPTPEPPVPPTRTPPAEGK
jgi:hypothetical protein